MSILKSIRSWFFSGKDFSSEENFSSYIQYNILKYKKHIDRKIFKNVIDQNDSISVSDSVFLQLVCLAEKPKKIMEIGTWIGYSTNSMAKVTDAKIFTCDKGNNKFIRIDGINNIVIHPNTHSTDFLDKVDGGFDMIFVDAFIEDEDIDKIFKKCNDKFTFVAHDYYDGSEELNFCKGYWATKKMMDYAQINGYSAELFAPPKEWYFNGFIPKGYLNKTVNAGCVMVKFKKDSR